MSDIINIAIDGPAGAGKSTIAKLVAKKKNFIYVDTGAMYRALALFCSRNGIAPEDEEKVIENCGKCDIKIEYKDGVQYVILNGENVNDFIRTEEISRFTSMISAYPKVREILLDLQRNLAKENNVIMDGRDIGTNILPDADLKIYLTASVSARANRRYKEQCEKGYDVDLEEIKKDIEDRDYRDMHKEVGALKVADDAVTVDSSDMSIDEVVAKIAELIDNIEK